MGGVVDKFIDIEEGWYKVAEFDLLFDVLEDGHGLFWILKNRGEGVFETLIDSLGFGGEGLEGFAVEGVFEFGKGGDSGLDFIDIG